ncbi:FAD/NAD(P)-binding protein [Kribbella sp. NPDC050124]|uniref:FAD/NAD(P)-binding protein n=1 Tax=Kribbella sp. NPDC050124 TaxID=3364114 RepID=UPI0037911B92
MTVADLNPWKQPPATVVFVGGGPRTVGLLERFTANADELLGSREMHIHVVDPYPAGGGRIWRREQSRLLWMNSMTSDVTIFTDESVECEGPITPGPDLATWVAGEGAVRLEKAGLDLPGPMDFPPRLVQAEYLAWVWERVLRDLPAPVTTHLERAVEVTDDRVVLASGKEIAADVVVLALGYLDRLPTPAEAAWATDAAAAGLTYIPPGYTADVDLSDLRPGEDVIVRGFGQAFVDLMVLLTEGRGGWYDACDGLLSYRPCGDEPILYVGSRRGVPYHAKLGYTVAGTKPVPTRYLTKAALDELGDGLLDFTTQVSPLIEKELTFAHYQQLFTAHPERTRWSWQDFAEVLDRWSPSEFEAAVADAVPDPADRFVRAEVDRPLAGRFFEDRERFEEFLTGLIETDLLRRADPEYSADLAVFNALLSVYGVLSVAITEGRLSDEDRVRHVETEWHGFFSFVASGPPPRRLKSCSHCIGPASSGSPAPTLTLPLTTISSWPGALAYQGRCGPGRSSKPGCRVPTYSPPPTRCCADRRPPASSPPTNWSPRTGRVSAAVSSRRTRSAARFGPTGPCTRRCSCSGRRCPARPGRRGSPGRTSTAPGSGRTTRSPGTC